MKTENFFLKLVVDRDEKPDEFDWKPPLDRRAALKIFGAGALGSVVAGCGGGSSTSSSSGSSSASSSGSSSTTATTASLGVSAASTTVGTSVTLTAMVAPSTATGSVTFYNGTTSLGTATLSSGVAMLTTSFSSAQTASITATYGGSSTYAASTSSAVSITVTAIGTTSSTTSLSVSTTSTTVDASVTLTAQVTPSAATGSVTFYNGSTSLGTGTISSGIVALTTSFSSAQTASLTAVYGGNSTYAASTSSAVSVAVTVSGSSCGASTNAVTEGPYWVDDTASGYNRSDIRSDIAGTNTQSGVLFTLNIYVYDTEKSCVAMQNVQVDVWHCDATGVYSGIQSSTNGNGVDYTSQSWLRGYQLTDSAGLVSFTTIVPGWYTGRTTHIHIRFRSTYDTSSDGSTNTAQLFFDQTFINNLNTSVSPYSTHGSNSVTNAGDSIYNAEGGTTVLSLSGSASAGYTATFTVYLPLT
jgi:protocatechuate 3,4-dioxygenase beta subunit